jgi:photosystem II stability/assembly factor-like uncharacterized protein
MAIKIKRTLIPLVLLLILFSASQNLSTGQTPDTNLFLPLVNNNPTGWIGPDAGTIVSLAIDPINPQIVYAGSFGSGVFKSQDGGKTWQPASQGLANLYVNSMAINPSNPSTVYVGTYRNQVFKSTDGGNTWYWSGTGMQDGTIVYSIAIDPYSPSVIFAGTRGISNNGNPPWSGVVYKSTDAALTWEPVLTNLGGPDLQDWAYSLVVNPHSHNEVLLAAHESGPYKSINYGENWFSIDNGINPGSGDTGRSIVIGQQPEDAFTYFYGVWRVDSVYKTKSGGSVWALANKNISNQHVYSITLDPQNINNVYLATFTSGIIKSTDAGNSWQSGGLPLDDIYSVAIDPFTTSQLLAGTSGDGVYRSEDSAKTWLHSSTGIENAMVTAVVISPVDNNISYASLYGGGVSQHDKRNNSWAEISNGLSDRFVWDLVMDPAHPGLLYALTNEAGLFRNDLNTGNGWILTGSGLPLTNNNLVPAYPPDHPFATREMQEAMAGDNQSTTLSPSFFTPLIKMVFAPADPLVVYMATAGSGVYRSNNAGQSWQSAGLATESIVTLAVDRFSSYLVYAATGTPGGTMVSTDGGSHWDNSGLATTCYSLMASPVQAGVLYAGTSDGIYRYQAGVWTPMGLSGRAITVIQLDPTHSGRIFAGADQGAYYSLDSGQTWIFADKALTGQTIEAISLDPINPNLVYFSTETHGIFLLAFQF